MREVEDNAHLALSTGESELGAVARGAAEGLGLRSILEDFGISVKLLTRSDAFALKYILNPFVILGICFLCGV